MSKFAFFLISASSVGLLLFWWASTYNIKWLSKQMFLLAAIMFIDRALYHAWMNWK